MTLVAIQASLLYYFSGLHQRHLHDCFHLSNPVGHNLYSLRHPYQEDTRGVQRVQTHRIFYVHHLRGLVLIHPHLFQHGTAHCPSHHLHVHHHQVWFIYLRVKFNGQGLMKQEKCQTKKGLRRLRGSSTLCLVFPVSMVLFHCWMSSSSRQSVNNWARMIPVEGCMIDSDW